MNTSFIMSERRPRKEEGECVRVVFWGSERGSYVTSNMLILAVYLACRKGYRITMLELAEEEKTVRDCFGSRKGAFVKNYIRTLIERQLYCIAMEEWEKCGEEKLSGLLREVESNMDMVFINLADRTDAEARKVMHSADLTVVNLKQEQRAFDRYYAGYSNLPSETFLLLMGNYYYDKGYDKEYMQAKYRIPEWQLAVIPNNAEYEMACAGKCMEQYMRKYGKTWRTVRKNQFLKDVEQSAELLCGMLFRKKSCLKEKDNQSNKKEMAH